MSKETIDTLILSIQEEIQQSVMRIIQEKLLSHYRSELDYYQKKISQKEENIELKIVEKDDSYVEAKKDVNHMLQQIIQKEEKETGNTNTVNEEKDEDEEDEEEEDEEEDEEEEDKEEDEKEEEEEEQEEEDKEEEEQEEEEQEEEQEDEDKEEEQEEEQDKEEQEEEVVEIWINKKKYYTNNEIDGDIYEADKNDDPGDIVGHFKNKNPIFK